jgi:hypothetical protein
LTRLEARMGFGAINHQANLVYAQSPIRRQCSLRAGEIGQWAGQGTTVNAACGAIRRDAADRRPGK